MRDRKKRNIIIGSLCCLLVFMGIGYAILSQTLNISGIANMKGNWNVKITNMELVDETKTGRAEEVSHVFTDTTATFEANLYMPGDSIEYRVTVENQGNIDALLKSITPTTTNKNVNIKFSHSEIDNTVLTAGKTITFTMKVEFLEDATTIPDLDSLKYSLELVYVQYNGGDYTPAVETTEESCFMISDDGTLISYDKNCGTDNVVIPAKINNIPVKRITPMAFVSIGGGVAITSTGDVIYLFKDETARDNYIAGLRNDESSDSEINEVLQTSYINGSTEFNALELKTVKDYVLEFDKKFKVYKDSSNTIKFERGSSSDYNIIYGSFNSSIYPNQFYCTTNDACDLLKEYYRSKDPARNYGVTDSSYYEYLYKPSEFDDLNYAADFQTLDNLDYVYYDSALPDMNEQTKAINTIDLSYAIYIEYLSNDLFTTNFNNDILKKIILPPNVKHVNVPLAEEVIFPTNSTTEIIESDRGAGNPKVIKLPSSLKVIGSSAFQGSSLTTVTIPSSVVRIGENAFASAHLKQGNIETLKFEKNSNLIAIYGDDDTNDDYSEGAFGKNKLTNITIPKSVEYIGYETFVSNKLTSVSFEDGSKLKYIGGRAFTGNQLTNTGLGKFPSTLTNLDTSAFSNNENLTQITLTSPADIDGWTNGSTVNGITVTYER